ncbi:MAG: putative toxin-antitoxin system toxin component, PIN family [Synergistaceae bacterium]|nr:putative toxin-antitoxin system toxin component, PIN family [Synergistaceae bacterium]
MKIVINTNIVISAVFFGGKPKIILKAVGDEKIDAFASKQIINEYFDTADKMVERKQGHFKGELLDKFISEVKVVEPKLSINICRDPDDNKFLECAADVKAYYIVSGDKDLLTIQKYDDIEIVTAAEFCNMYPEIFS